MFQCFKFDEATGNETVYNEDRLSPAFELAPVAQRRLAIGHVARISRVVAIHEDGNVIAQPAWPSPTRPEMSMPADKTAAARMEYLDNWIKQLP